MNIEWLFDKVVIPVIVAVITAVTVIAVERIKNNKEYDVKIILTDAETQESIDGKIFIDGGEGISIHAGKEPMHRLTKGNHLVRVESPSYQTENFVVSHSQDIRYLDLEKRFIPPLFPLSLMGWNSWGGIRLTSGVTGNECIVNSVGVLPDAAGFVSVDVVTGLRGRTLVLYFSNTNKSDFSRNRMVKLTYNWNDTLLSPKEKTLIYSEYLPVGDTLPSEGIEFPIPDDFDGKLGFVFFQAELKDLKITAYYK